MATIKTRHAVAGAVLGALSGWAMVAALFFSPWILLPSVLISALGIWSGIPAAIIATISNVFWAYSLGGGLLTLVVIETMVLPAWCAIALVARSVKYRDGLKLTVVMQCGALLVLVLGIQAATGGDISQYLANLLRGSIASYPEEYVEMAVSYMGQAGAFGQNTGIDFTVAMTSSQVTALLDAYFNAYEEAMRLSLAAMLVNTGVITGAASYVNCARLAAKRGEFPEIGYVLPCQWRLPRYLLFIPPLVMLAFYLAGDAPSAQAGYLAMERLCTIIYMVQGIGFVVRFFQWRGMSNKLSFAIIALAAVLLPIILVICGVASVVFGIASTAIKKHRNKGDK